MKADVAYINDIKAHFRDNYIDANKAWGQFLDGNIAIRQAQFGRYGTAAGAIIYGILGEKTTVASSEVLRTLEAWANAHDDHSTQTLVYAMLLAGIASLSTDTAQTQRFVEVLLSRRTSKNLWGNYWITTCDYDNSESIFVSAIVVLTLSFALKLHSLDASSVNAFKESRLSLESRYLENADAHKEYAEMVFAALTSDDTAPPSTSVIEKLKAKAFEEIDITDKFIYFYDFKRLDGSFGREYFITPKEVFSIIAGHSKHAPSPFKLRAKLALNEIKANIDSNLGLYKSAPQSRASTLEQAFVGMAVITFRNQETKGIIAGISLLRYELAKERAGLDKFGIALYILTYCLIGVATFYVASGYFEGSPIKTTLTNACILLTASLRDPKELTKIFFGIFR